MEFVLFPRYEDIYPDSVPELKKIISGIPTSVIVGFACHVNSKKHFSQFDFKIDWELYHLLIGRLSKEKFDYLDGKLKEFCELHFKAHDAETFTIFPITHMFHLIEFALQHYQEGEYIQISPEQEENLLKAVLTINTLSDIKSIPEKIPKGEFLDGFAKLCWPNILPAFEHSYKREIIIPIYQSILLFHYIESKDDFKPFLEIYLKNVGVEKALDYVKSLMALYIFSFNKNDGAYSSHFNEDTLKNHPILQQYIYNVDTSLSEVFDSKVRFYRLLRKKPIFRINNTQLYISNWNFIIDKIYEGFLRDFFEYSEIKTILEGRDDGKKWNSFTQLLNQGFSEKVIFKDMIDRYFKHNEIITQFEDIPKGWNQDLYLRTKNHVCFIEFKGSVLPISDDYKTIKHDIDKNMLVSESGSKKAVYQLIEQIRQFHENINKFEQLDSLGYSLERLFIYPIIIYTNFNWRLPGIHDYLSRIFKEEIMKYNFKFFGIEELAFIHLDFFYDHEGSFIRDHINLHEVVHRTFLLKDSYRQRAKRPTSYQDLVGAIREFEFYASQVFKDGYTSINKMSLFNEILQKLDLPQN